MPFIAAATPAIAETGIAEYRPVFEAVRAEDGRKLIAIRRFRRDGQEFLLTVEPQSLVTRIRPLAWTVADGLPDDKTPYLSALASLTSPPYRIENTGLVHALHPVDGIFLTVDLCPSRKAYEARFFSELGEVAAREGRPTPVAISISGYWALEHQSELTAIIESERRREIEITWVNHSYTHRYARGLPDTQNFLLMPNTDFDREVLKTEELMIARGLTPSVFFRFPGLVSDEDLVLKLRKLGLIPLGADAWLAKGRRARQGGIVLVHGNGNEPLGIREVRPYLTDPRVKWLPLTDAIAGA
ncbi:polysaccharide deacetylase [Parvibaculum sp.]|uniref:polysaccharide deacetylase n=1 Tax=Parvibaculum sp. TaxID=2024848 RepID=UPI00320D681C